MSSKIPIKMLEILVGPKQTTASLSCHIIAPLHCIRVPPNNNTNHNNTNNNIKFLNLVLLNDTVQDVKIARHFDCAHPDQHSFASVTFYNMKALPNSSPIN